MSTTATKITLPELTVIALVGASGSGKSTFAHTHFKPSEILSSDACREMVSDDENAQDATNDAFDVLYYIAAKRLVRGNVVVIDATNVKPQDRKKIIELAREHHVVPVAIALDLPESVCKERNAGRDDRDFGAHVIPRQREQVRKSLRSLKKEGFRHVHVLSSVEEVEAVTIELQPLWNNKKTLTGPFDIIGDIHGCYDELVDLLVKLGWTVDADAHTATPPDDRMALFLGDYVDRGPRTPDVLRLLMNMVEAGHALAVPGNHDQKLVRKLMGRDVKVTHGLAETLEQLEQETQEFRDQVRSFLDGLVSHYVLDDGNLVMAHAGMVEHMQGRGSGKVREFALWGETTGETDEYGLPVRYHWAADYRGKAAVVYGHTPIPEPEWLNRTINIDTGCVFGGSLTALRYPEKELVSVPARETYYEPVKPLLPPEGTVVQRPDDILDLADVTGKRIVDTRLRKNVTIEEGNAVTALEVMSRFAANPRWLIYLPPTMSPSETTKHPGMLEYPTEAFDHYRSRGVSEVVVEEKHMGSRAVVIVCRDEDVAKRRFRINEDEAGICYTRTGRRFFDRDTALEQEFIARLQAAMTTSGLWDELGTDWICLDSELMPWSAKAQKLITEQYAAVGAAARGSLGEVVETLQTASTRLPEAKELLGRFAERQQLADAFTSAYRHYCWPVSSLADLKLAPFHILATEGATHTDKDHVWHMETIAKLCAADPELLLATPYRRVDLNDEEQVRDATAWWEERTGKGGEGMVIKPLDFIAFGKKGLLQPAVKCRGPEYLRIIYGPEYTLPENLERLRERGVGRKRSLALREFALGVEALDRFVKEEPLYRVHECVFGVLALESEPMDPRL